MGRARGSPPRNTGAEWEAEAGGGYWWVKTRGREGGEQGKLGRKPHRNSRAVWGLFAGGGPAGEETQWHFAGFSRPSGFSATRKAISETPL